jgi:hypothetical protein
MEMSGRICHGCAVAMLFSLKVYDQLLIAVRDCLSKNAHEVAAAYCTSYQYADQETEDKKRIRFLVLLSARELYYLIVTPETSNVKSTSPVVNFYASRLRLVRWPDKSPSLRHQRNGIMISISFGFVLDF